MAYLVRCPFSLCKRPKRIDGERAANGAFPVSWCIACGIRRRRRPTRAEAKKAAPVIVEREHASPLDLLLEAEIEHEIDAVLSTLPDRDRMIIRLRFGFNGACREGRPLGEGETWAWSANGRPIPQSGRVRPGSDS